MTTPTDAQVEAAEAAVYPRHERGFLIKPLIDPIDMRAALTAAFSLAPAGTVEVSEDEVRKVVASLREWRADSSPLSRNFDVQQLCEQAADIIDRFSVLLPPQPSAVTEAQAAYGLLWRMRTTDKAIHEARRSLLSAIGKDGQRAGLDWALATFGPHKAPTLEELP